MAATREANRAQAGTALKPLHVTSRGESKHRGTRPRTSGRSLRCIGCSFKVCGGVNVLCRVQILQNLYTVSLG